MECECNSEPCPASCVLRACREKKIRHHKSIDDEPHVQALCDKLIANHPTLTEAKIDYDSTDDIELKVVLDATKENKIVKKLPVSRRSLSLSLASQFQRTLRSKLVFMDVI